MKTLYCILLTIFISYFTQAQQVTKIDCCVEIGGKAAIIINDNSNTGTLNSTPVNTTAANGGFDFKLGVAANTSAGIYDKNDVLVRTLWSGVWYEAGCYSGKWDGYLDDGATLAPLGTYTAKVLTNNVAYEWLGVIGNSSASHLSNEFLIGNGIYSLTVAGGNCYLAGGYAERDITTIRFALNDLGKSYFVSPGTQSVSAFSVCSNSNYVFYAGEDSYSQTIPKFLYAFNPTTEQQINFTNGRPYNIQIDNRLYSSVLGYSENGGNHILSIAATDNFIFAARETGVIETYDLRNNSGALLFTTPISEVGRITIAGNKLWAIVNGVPKQYTIASNGTITATGLSLNLSNASALKYNSFSNEIVAGDLNTQTWKFYSAATGNYKSALGVPGGYANGPAVTNYKFHFEDIKGRLGPQPLSDITFQPDGSFLISDIGNYRINRYNPDHSYKDQISYVTSSRSCAADQNNPTRVFADKLEYQVDYSKVATDINASWKLVNNWSVGTDLNEFEQFKGVITLPNGITYGYGSPGGSKHLYKLDPANGAVYLKDIGSNEILEADGSLYDRVNNNNINFLVTKRNLTSDRDVMLNWGNPIIIATTPNIDANFPFYYINNNRGASTNPNRQFFYNPNYNYGFGNNGNDRHLVSIKKGANTIDWQASKSTGGGYYGAYPENGDFATNGGHSENALLNINGSNLFTHVNDELGQYTQVARTNHFNENGLFIGHFGTDNTTVGYTGDTRFWAGNSFSTNLVKVGNDLYYLYCDESKHSGVHLIKISNLSSIAIQSIPLTVSAAVTLVADPSDLMAGLPYHGTSLNNALGWTIEAGTPGIVTTYLQYEKGKNDISISGNRGDRAVSRFLSNQTSNSYTASMQVNFANSQDTFSDFNVYNLLALCDQSGKVLAIVYQKGNGIYVNNTLIAAFTWIDKNTCRNVVFTCTNGSLKVKFADYAPVTISSFWENGAAVTQPGFIKVLQHVAGYRNDHTAMNICKMRFTKAIF